MFNGELRDMRDNSGPAAPGMLAGSQGRGGRADSPTVHVRRGARWAGVMTTKNL